MAANMAVRKDLLEQIGGFDECLGAGSPYGGAEEMDVAYRIARAGWMIVRAVHPCVIHNGFRPKAEASALFTAYGAGLGAMYAKHVRCGDVNAARLLTFESAIVLRKAFVSFIRRRRPLGLRALQGYLVGAASSLSQRVDKDRRIYLPKSLTVTGRRPSPTSRPVH
jgi:hypothetical protein